MPQAAEAPVAARRGFMVPVKHVRPVARPQPGARRDERLTLVVRKTLVTLLAALGVSASRGAAQVPTTNPTPAGATTTAPVATQPSDQLEKWKRYLTEDNTLSTRMSACRDMIDQGGPTAIEWLAQLLAGDSAATAKLAVCRTIAMHPNPPVWLAEPLRNLLDGGGPDAQLRDAAAAALGAYRDPNVVTTLSRDLADAKLPVARRLSAARALGYVRDVERAVDPLIAALGDPDADVRVAAMGSLRQIMPVDFGPDPEAWKAWWTREGRELSGALVIRLREARQQAAALEARYTDLMRQLYSLTPEDHRDALLLDWFKSPLAVERRAAIKVVHEGLLNRLVPSEKVATAIRRMLADPDPQVRLNVVIAIRDSRQPDDVDRLVDHLSRETSALVKPAIFDALGRLRDPKAAPVCIAALSDPDPSVVAEAVKALGLIVEAQRDRGGNGTSEAVRAVASRFRVMPGDPVLRGVVVDAMARMRDPAFAPVLRTEAGDGQPSGKIRQAGVYGLELLADPANVDVVTARLSDKDAGVREAAAKAMGVLGNTPADLAALAARLDPSVETAKTVQTKAWDAYREVFARLDLDAQLTVMRSMEVKADTADRVLQLVPLVEKKLPPTGVVVDTYVGLLLRAADALTGLKRDADAATLLRKAIPLMQTAPAERQHEVYLKALAALLRAGQGDESARLLSANPPTTRPSNATTGKLIADYVESLVAANTPDAAIVLIDALVPAMTGRFDDEWINKLAAIRREAVERKSAAPR